ncbi:MAG TPA: hypothetical protein VJ869_07360 [Sphaerochaeta sp.]|nr:hypothetical protein [Sphaerochaeta sp.]
MVFAIRFFLTDKQQGNTHELPCQSSPNGTIRYVHHFFKVCVIRLPVTGCQRAMLQ